MIDTNVIHVQTGEGTNNDSRLVSYNQSVSCDDYLVMDMVELQHGHQIHI